MPRANWLYFLGSKKNKQELFVYGLSMQTKCQWLYDRVHKIGKVGDKKLYLFESVSNDIDLSDLDKEQLKLNLFHDKVESELKIEHINKYIQNYDSEKQEYIPLSPIGQTVYMNVLYSKLFYEYQDGFFLKEENKPYLKELLYLLEQNNGQNFKSGYHQRLGCFEYAETMPWAETSVPFKISSENKAPNTYKLTRSEDLKNEIQTVHLIVSTNNNNVLLDEIKSFEKGQLSLEFKTEIIDDSCYEYSVFDALGKLIHKDKGAWMQAMSLRMHTISDTVTLETVEKGKTKSTTISAYSPMNTVKVKYPDDKNIQNIKSNTRIIKALCDSKPVCSTQKWFDKNEDSVEEIMKYINSYLAGTNNIITIIDPFFSAGAMYALSQINNTSTLIRVVSCWESKKDPDDGSDTTKEQLAQQVKANVNALKNTYLPIGKMSWHDLGAENFHDRYIWINQDGKDLVFSISNSMNNLLKDYHFTMVELTGVTKEKTLKYLNEILAKCNSENKILPEEDNV